MKSEYARAAKRLLEAIGYLELGMIQHTRDCLIDAGNSTALSPAAKMIRDEAVRRESCQIVQFLAVDFSHAMAPEPVDEDILLALSRCFREAGESERAEEVLAYTRPTVRGHSRHYARRSQSWGHRKR